MDVNPQLARKQAALDARLRALGRTLVAYSGGVDSAFLAWAAHKVVGENMLAVIADSPSLARKQLADALSFAEEQSIPVMTPSAASTARTSSSRSWSNSGKPMVSMPSRTV
jgi:uncharacterized protein